MDQAAWKRHIMLDKETGLDPPGVKLRAAQGFDAADFFITGYWDMEQDSRKSCHNRLRSNERFYCSIRLATVIRQSGGPRPILHAFEKLHRNRTQDFRRQTYHHLTLYGSQVFFYFMKWVEHPSHGAGGPQWVDKHIDSWINISGCMLGAVKGIPAVLSGEMKDTAQLNALAVYGLERFISRQDRTEIFRAMPGISSMLPKGGDAVWGNMTYSPEDAPVQTIPLDPSSLLNHLLIKPTTFPNRTSPCLTPCHTFSPRPTPGIRTPSTTPTPTASPHTKREVESNQNQPRTWVNPLESRLPLAPNLKIYCFYGIGKPTERAYFYKEDPSLYDPSSSSQINITIDTGYTSAHHSVDHGVISAKAMGPST